MQDLWVQNACLTNFGAGVETIGTTVGTLMINISSHPECQARIHKEIDEARKNGKLSYPPKLREMKQSLPYLSACLSESMRLHPVIGIPMMRVVPGDGVQLEGQFLPEGVCGERIY